MLEIDVVGVVVVIIGEGSVRLFFLFFLVVFV